MPGANLLEVAQVGMRTRGALTHWQSITDKSALWNPHWSQRRPLTYNVEE